MLHRRTLIVAVSCALPASVAGVAAAMPEEGDRAAPSAEVELFQQRAASPHPPQAAGIDAHEVAVFHARADRFAAERSRGDDALDRATAPEWFDALMVRRDALNRTFGLGAYAGLAH